MKYRYGFHYADYAIDENEQLYEKMVAKGWKLIKRGSFLDKYERCEPKDMRYRIEISSPGFLEDAELPEDQVALYEDCGWEFIANHGLVHVFCADKDSDAQEFYSDPRQQAATLSALRRSYRSGWISVLIIIAVHLFIAYGLSSEPDEFLPGVWASLMETWFRSTELVLTYAVLLVSALYDLIYGTVRTALLYRQLKAGKPLEHAPKKRLPHKTTKTILWVLQGIVLVLLAVQLFGIEKYDMPIRTEEPYLTLAHDLSVPGQRDEMTWQSDGSTVERGHSLAADTVWFTHEHVGDQWLYQHIYRLRSEEQVESCVNMLMFTSTFAKKPEAFKEIAINGLDAAYISGLDGIAVKDRTVYYMTYSERDWEHVFSALAEKLR